MSFPTIANALLGPNPEYIISPRISAILDKLPSADQRQIIEQLENFIEQLRADGSTEHLQRLGVLDPKTSDTDDQKKGCVLEKCYWQLAQFYRYTTPSRIAEAEPALRYVLDTYARANPNATVRDVVPMLYLGVALTKGSGKEAEALETFTQAFEHLNKTPQPVVKNAIWARAHMGRLLRRMGKTSDSDRQRDLIKLWLKEHPYVILPSEFKKLVSDMDDAGPNYILEDPQIKQYFRVVSRNLASGTDTLAE